MDIPSFIVFAVLMAGALAQRSAFESPCEYGFMVSKNGAPIVCSMNGQGCKSGQCTAIENSPIPVGVCCRDSSPCASGDPEQNSAGHALQCELTPKFISEDCGTGYTCETTAKVCCLT